MKRKSQGTMLFITTKLKRVKILRLTLSIIMLPVRLPFYLISQLGQFGELILDKTDPYYFRIEAILANKFKWNEVAKKQFSENPSKFK